MSRRLGQRILGPGAAGGPQHPRDPDAEPGLPGPPEINIQHPDLQTVMNLQAKIRITTALSAVAVYFQTSDDDENSLFNSANEIDQFLASVPERISSTICPLTWSLEDIKMKLSGRPLKQFVRLNEDEFKIILEALQAPRVFYYDHFHKMNTTLAFYLVLRRLAVNLRNADLGLEVGLQTSLVSSAHVNFIRILWPNIERRLNSFDHSWLSRNHLETFARAMHQHPVLPYPLNCIIGWIDGKCMETKVPVRGARRQYCGHHHRCVMKFLIFSFPNGLIVPYGPFRGGSNDAGCARQIGLPGLLEEYFKFPDRTFAILADGGFRADDQVIIPYSGDLTPDEARYNTVHSFHRVSIEMAIGQITSAWQRFRFAKGLSPHKSNIAQQFLFGVHILNMLTCIRGSNLVNSRYSSICKPPTLEEYMAIYMQ